MNRRVGLGVLFVALGVGFLFAGECVPTTPETMPVPVDEETSPAAVSAPAAPLTLLPAEAGEDSAVLHGALSGRVVSWGSGVGVVGAEVTFAHDGATHALRTSASGAFELLAPEPGRYELAVVSAEGYLPFAPEWGHSPVVFHTRARQRISGITIYLSPAVLYHGVVEDPAGESVAGATVRVVGEEGAGLALAPALEPVASDPRGAFAIAAPDYALLEASHPEWTPGRTRIDFAAQVSHRLRIRLGAPADDTERYAIAGRVHSAGEPIEGALVEARFAAANPAAPEVQLRTTGRAASNADGSYEVTGLDPGTYSLSALARGFAPALRPVVRAGSRDIEIELTPGSSLRGTVIDALTGAPVPTFALLISPPRFRQRVESVLDADGAYRVDDLGPGIHRVRVAAYGYATSAPQKVTLVAGQSDAAELDFELTAGGRVHGRVIDEVTRAPLSGARVSCETGGVRARDAALPVAASALTDPSGHFELRGVATGLRSLIVAASGHHGRIISGLEVEDDGDIGPLTIELTPVAEGDQPRLELTGIGAVLSSHEGGYVIGETLPGGGAVAAGLVSGDLIIAIDGTPASELEFTDAIEKIRGVEGSTLTLTVRKGESGEEVEIVTTRRRVRR